MKLAELFEAPYILKGPPRGNKLPVTSGDPNIEMHIDLKDKRIDVDNPQGTTISPKISEIDQKNIVAGLAGQTIVIPEGPRKGTWMVINVSGYNLTCVDPMDQSGDPPQVIINASPYYVDPNNSDGMVHLELERSRASQYSTSAVDLGRGATINVVG